MDLYALQMTPRKKTETKPQEIKKIDAHLLTKDELIADLSRGKSLVDSGNDSERKTEIQQPVEIEKKFEVEKAVEIVAEKKEPTKKNKIAPWEKFKRQVRREEKSLVGKIRSPFEMFSPNLKTQSEPKKKKGNVDMPETAVNVTANKISFEKHQQKFKSQSEARMQKAQVEKREAPIILNESKILPVIIPQEKKELTPSELPRKNPKIEESTNIAEYTQVKVVGAEKMDSKQEYLTSLTEIMATFNEDALRNWIEKISDYRAKNEQNAQLESPLNVAIRQKLLGGISAQLAYGKVKNIINTFQLLDILGIEITAADLTAMPVEVLKSEELSSAASRYLLLFAKEYSDSPLDIEKRIACFVSAGLMTGEDIHTKDFSEVFEKNLLEYAKEHQKNPSEIERKIYQYSLAGLVNGVAFKKGVKIRDLSRGFIYTLVERYLERIEDTEKKIAEFEHCGLVSRDELRSDTKLQKLLEKYLMHYIKTNLSHARKTNMRVNEFYRIGLISVQLKEDLLRVIRTRK